MNTQIPDRRTAVEGEVFTYAKKFQHHEVCQGEFTVVAKGEGNEGQWVCISCGEPIENQLMKDCHCHGKRKGASRLIKDLGTPALHVLAWRSFVSGMIEVP